MAEKWFAGYQAAFPDYEKAALQVKAQLQDAIKGAPLHIQLIETRAKHPDSVWEKIQRHGYGRPKTQFDDLLGARIITLYEHTIAEAEERIRSRFQVVEERSSNKSAKLGVRQVGYRSSHLVIRAQRSGLGNVANILNDSLVEVQIRSVISHAWAEIEHSLRYKVGKGIPDSLARRFDALAGTLELVDREFSSIAADTVSLVGAKAQRFSASEDLDEELNSLQLMAALIAKRPHMPALGSDGLPLEIEDAFRFARLLRECGLTTAGAFLNELGSWTVREAIAHYGDPDVGDIEPEKASAIVVLGAVIGTKDPDLFLSVRAFRNARLLKALSIPEALWPVV